MRNDIFEVDPREAKLPVWAQEKLKNARTQVQCERALADEARQATDPDGSNAIMHWYGGRQPVGLGRDARVRFKVKPLNQTPKQFRDDWIDVRSDENGGLVLYGGTQLIVVPQVTNVLHVELRQL